MLINADSGSGITNTLPHLIKQQDDYNYSVIDKIYLYLKDPNERKANILLKNVKTVVSNDWEMQRLLSNFQIICRMSIKLKPRKEMQIVNSL